MVTWFRANSRQLHIVRPCIDTDIWVVPAVQELRTAVRCSSGEATLALTTHVQIPLHIPVGPQHCGMTTSTHIALEISVLASLVKCASSADVAVAGATWSCKATPVIASAQQMA